MASMAVSYVSQLLLVLVLTALAEAQVPRDPDDQIGYYMMNPSKSPDTRRRLPEDTTESIVFNFYLNSDNPPVQLKHDGSDALPAGWDPERTAKIIIHGFGNNVNSDFSVNLRNSYLNYGDFNVLVVDWGSLCQKPNYFRAVGNVASAGRYIGEFILKLIKREVTERRYLHFVGHSLGAHVAGFAASWVPVAHRITALDPAGPLFNNIYAQIGIALNSALIIDSIMTDAGRLGNSKHLGKINFLPNGGSGQTGCGFDPFGTCNHRRAYQYFEESIYTRRNFPATRCGSYKDFVDGKCGRPDSGMGDAVSFRFDGDYYLHTNAFTPFNKG